MNTCSITDYNFSNLSFHLVTGAALADSVNPCAIAVLIILISALLMNSQKKQAIKTGLFFIAAIFLAYFLLGLGLFSVIRVTNIAPYIHRIVGILAIIIGLFNIKDFFWYGGAGFVSEIPRAWRPKMKEILTKATSPTGAFIAGLVVTAFELPCTGGPYVFVLGLLSQSLTWIKIIPILLYYNFIFILPLLILTGLIYFGYSSVEKAAAWKEKNLRILHLIAGLIMLALGVWVFLN